MKSTLDLSAVILPSCDVSFGFSVLLWEDWQNFKSLCFVSATYSRLLVKSDLKVASTA